MAPEESLKTEGVNETVTVQAKTYSGTAVALDDPRTYVLTNCARDPIDIPCTEEEERVKDPKKKVPFYQNLPKYRMRHRRN